MKTINMPRRHCGRCHSCGQPLKRCLDGEEWCSVCQTYRRYPSHGWSKGACTESERQEIECPVQAKGQQNGQIEEKQD